MKQNKPKTLAQRLLEVTERANPRPKTAEEILIDEIRGRQKKLKPDVFSNKTVSVK